MFCHLWNSPFPCGSINCWQFLPAHQGPRPSSLCLIILYILKSWLFKLKINFTAFLVGTREEYLLLVGKLENTDKKKKSSNMVISIYIPSAICENFSSSFLSEVGVFCHFHFSHYVDICISCVYCSFGILFFFKYLFKSLTRFSVALYSFLLLICRNFL